MPRHLGRYTIAAALAFVTALATCWIDPAPPPIDPVKLSLQNDAEQRATIEALEEAWVNRRTSVDPAGARQERIFLHRVGAVVRATRGSDASTHAAARRLWNIVCSDYVRRFPDLPHEE